MDDRSPSSDSAGADAAHLAMAPIEARPGPEATSSDPTGERRRARNALVEEHYAFVERYVRRYSGRGVPREDLRQVALLALVQAADRFDPSRETTFRTFAGATVDGAIKRHFRDATWAVRPPRALQELHLRVRRADGDLAHRLGRRPTISEVAHEVDVDVDRLHLVLEAGGGHDAVTIDGSTDATGESDHVQPFLGRADPAYLRMEERVVLEPALAALDEPTRELLRMRFVDQMSQQEISERLGVSQSYLSRMLRKVLADIRRQIREPEAMTISAGRPRSPATGGSAAAGRS